MIDQALARFIVEEALSGTDVDADGFFAALSAIVHDIGPRNRALRRKRDLERQPLEINSLVEDVLQFVSGDAALRGVSLTADLGPVLPKVAGETASLADKSC